MCRKRLCSFSLPRYFQISFLSHALPVTGHRGGSIWEAIWEAHSSWDDPDNYRQTKRRSAHDNDCDLPTSVSSDGIDPTYNFHSEVLINDYKTVRKTDDFTSSLRACNGNWTCYATRSTSSNQCRKHIVPYDVFYGANGKLSTPALTSRPSFWSQLPLPLSESLEIASGGGPEDSEPE